MNNSNDTIENRTRDIPTCSAVPFLQLYFLKIIEITHA